MRVHGWYPMRTSVLRSLPVLVSLAAAPIVADDDLSNLDLTLHAGSLGASNSSGGLTLGGEEIGKLEAAAIVPAASLSPVASFSPVTSISSELAPFALGASEGSGSSYVALRVGPIWFLGDMEDLHAGAIAELAFGYRILPILAIELQPGFIWGEDSNPSGDLWSVPLSANAKLTIPVLIFEVYAGAGAGGYWMHTKSGGSNEDDFVFGLSGFVGLNFTLGPFLLGAEGKYIWTDKFDTVGSAKPNFEGFALMAQAGLSF
jgi:hypothetical protein